MILFVHTADEAPPAPGAYALLLRLDAPLRAKAGRREATLEPGRYIYCGSAKGPGGMRARLARHMRRDKRAHWHIDQLTRAGRVEGAWIDSGGDECALSQALAHLRSPLPGFGASDCLRCESHLRSWPVDQTAFPATRESWRRCQGEKSCRES